MYESRARTVNFDVRARKREWVLSAKHHNQAVMATGETLVRAGRKKKTTTTMINMARLVDGGSWTRAGLSTCPAPLRRANCPVVESCVRGWRAETACKQALGVLKLLSSKSHQLKIADVASELTSSGGNLHAVTISLPLVVVSYFFGLS